MTVWQILRIVEQAFLSSHTEIGIAQIGSLLEAYLACSIGEDRYVCDMLCICGLVSIEHWKLWLND